jgi:hypothetical protein
MWLRGLTGTPFTFIRNIRITKLYISTIEVDPRPENQLLLTKGDNNALDDVELYRGLSHLERKHIVGKVRGYVAGLILSASCSVLTYLQFLAVCRLCNYCYGKILALLKIRRR